MKRILGCVLVLAAALQLTGLNVAEKELKKGGGQVRFTKYQGRYSRVLSRDEIRLIGFELARISRRNNVEYDLIRKYSILHAVGPAGGDRFDADIFSINERAQIVDIEGIRIILGAYLERRYKYSEQDALTVAKFITLYNAAHRGDMAFYRRYYKEAVTGRMNPRNAGISPDYRRWPGATKVVIPLSDTASRDITSIDTVKLTDDKVIKKLQTTKDKGVADRDKMLKIQKDQTGKKQQDLNKKQQDLNRKQQQQQKQQQDLNKQQQQQQKQQQDLDKKQQQVNQIKDPKQRQQQQQDLNKKQQDLDKKQQQTAKQQQDLNKKQQQTAKQQQDLNKKQQQLDKDKQKLTGDQKQLDKDKQQTGAATGSKPEDRTGTGTTAVTTNSAATASTNTAATASTNTAATAQDQAARKQALDKRQQDLDKRKQALDTREDRLKQQQSDKRIYADGFFYLKVKGLVDGGHYNNEMVLIDPATRKIVRRSGFTGICGRKYDVYSKGAVVIGHTGNHRQEHFLVLLDPKTLAVRARGSANIYWRSFVEVRDGKIYAVIVDGTAYRLGQFDEQLKLTAKSDEFVDRDSFISFFGDFIYLNGRDKKILVLNRKDLKKTAIIDP